MIFKKINPGRNLRLDHLAHFLWLKIALLCRMIKTMQRAFHPKIKLTNSLKYWPGSFFLKESRLSGILSISDHFRYVFINQ
jgi:hypothetical protein